MVGGGSKSNFWIDLLSSILNRTLSVCEQSEFSASLGVARLAMFADESNQDKNNIIREINSSKVHSPLTNNQENLLKRYEIWKDIYISNRKIAPTLLA